mmetsp:Transcript_19457/g.48748  ORF Transcript_19457/g.48748 Transcript_19457/m.48748 type:complete len:103 (-) Transcript_19457:962-1270(-)
MARSSGFLVVTASRATLKFVLLQQRRGAPGGRGTSASRAGQRWACGLSSIFDQRTGVYVEGARTISVVQHHRLVIHFITNSSGSIVVLAILTTLTLIRQHDV